MENHMSEQEALAGLKEALEALGNSMLKAEKEHEGIIQALPSAQRAACINLLHYLALRSEDLRDLQYHLHVKGLSSLSSAESHIHAQLTAILERLGKIPEHADSPCTYEQALKDMDQKAAALFGAKAEMLIPHIMATFDTAYADDYNAVKELLLSGMTVARINCAHDDESIWEKMIRNIQKASAETGIPCKIYMDIAGPKIRTRLKGKKKKKQKLELQEGERLLLVDSKKFPEEEGPARVIGCSMEGIIGQLKPGARVLFDDGIFECKVENIEDNIAVLTVTRISSPKPFLKEDKGINFPDSRLDISSLTDFDRACLPFIGRHADLVGYSFVRTAHDIVDLQAALTGDKVEKQPFIILKIETAEAVKHLPALLLESMKQPVFGVMIARGDLAIELGFERMSEIQEELVWICEAAHVPVIWATQVLETLNKSGLATRSEITDASYSALAECVMINKGKHIVEVITTLRDIFHRSGGHHVKKRYIFRPLNIAKEYIRS